MSPRMIEEDRRFLLGIVSELEATTKKLRALATVPEPPPLYSVTPYSQNDPRWKHLEYAGGTTFGRAGCYVVCAAMIVGEEPPTVAEKLREAECFSGNLLTKPQNIPNAYPGFKYDGPNDVSKDGPLRWHHGKADMERFHAELRKSPVITEVDFEPGGEFNQHFVVCLEWDEVKEDILVLDPWTGTERFLLETYSVVWQHWDLARAIYGVRLLRPK